MEQAPRDIVDLLEQRNAPYSANLASASKTLAAKRSYPAVVLNNGADGRSFFTRDAAERRTGTRTRLVTELTCICTRKAAPSLITGTYTPTLSDEPPLSNAADLRLSRVKGLKTLRLAPDYANPGEDPWWTAYLPIFLNDDTRKTIQHLTVDWSSLSVITRSGNPESLSWPRLRSVYINIPLGTRAADAVSGALEALGQLNAPLLDYPRVRLVEHERELVIPISRVISKLFRPDGFVRQDYEYYRTNPVVYVVESNPHIRLGPHDDDAMRRRRAREFLVPFTTLDPSVEEEYAGSNTVAWFDDADITGSANLLLACVNEMLTMDPYVQDIIFRRLFLLGATATEDTSLSYTWTYRGEPHINRPGASVGYIDPTSLFIIASHALRHISTDVAGVAAAYVAARAARFKFPAPLHLSTVDPSTLAAAAVLTCPRFADTTEFSADVHAIPTRNYHLPGRTSTRATRDLQWTDACMAASMPKPIRVFEEDETIKIESRYLGATYSPIQFVLHTVTWLWRDTPAYRPAQHTTDDLAALECLLDQARAARLAALFASNRTLAARAWACILSEAENNVYAAGAVAVALAEADLFPYPSDFTLRRKATVRNRRGLAELRREIARLRDADPDDRARLGAVVQNTLRALIHCVGAIDFLFQKTANPVFAPAHLCATTLQKTLLALRDFCGHVLQSGSPRATPGDDDEAETLQDLVNILSSDDDDEEATQFV